MTTPGTFTLTVQTDGAAFDGDGAYYELPRILRKIADTIDAGDLLGSHNTLDVNGNTCGAWSFTTGPASDESRTCDECGETDDGGPDWPAGVCPSCALGAAEDLADVLELLGWTVDVQPGDQLHDDTDRRDVDGWKATAHAYSWTITRTDGDYIEGAYWQGSAIDDDPDPVDVFAAVVMDADYLTAEGPYVPDGITLDDVDKIRAREAWILAGLGPDADDDEWQRLAELAAEHDG